MAETYVRETDEPVHVHLNGSEIVCTPEHPFYSPVKGWTAACKLRAGDVLRRLNGEYVVVEFVQHELLESPVAVYNGKSLGVDHCFDPTKSYSLSTKATSLTFGSGCNYGIGYDYYSEPISILRWRE